MIRGGLEGNMDIFNAEERIGVHFEIDISEVEIKAIFKIRDGMRSKTSCTKYSGVRWSISIRNTRETLIKGNMLSLFDVPVSRSK